MTKFKLSLIERYWDAEVEVDLDNPDTIAAMKSMVEFWVGYEHRLRMNDGDYTKTFLQQLAREIYYIVISNNYNLLGVVGKFEDREGWCTMDGAYGIRVLSIDDMEYDHDEFEVEEITS